MSEGGGRFAYHGDFDRGGVAIAAAVHERYGFEPWRLDAAAYEAAGVPVPYGGRYLLSEITKTCASRSLFANLISTVAP
ncbi:DUF2399 domain-containing protein [Nonomuraea aurantiaca]|uniref:DUF2399 domain-containing protein n=1 Tax=Nonomuraea aurantiaca TaxID=2878562 RepID=UPI001CD91C5A|nr:DUF2399 domain-containing protein [Nonomuraea aurantiaca]MCA2222749.1 DUF2399 domain-containing protein [Nonomuraea aurantiaca]